MRKVGTFNTFQHESIIRNQILFINYSQCPVKSSKDTFYVQDTYVSLEGLDNNFKWIFPSKIQIIMILNVFPEFQKIWSITWDFNPNFLFLMKLAVKQVPTIFMNMSNFHLIWSDDIKNWPYTYLWTIMD